jgi:FKBP-type peptidyl-prolyl cis-trans isomerase (trigger factor)
MKKLLLCIAATAMLLTGCGSKNTGDKATTAQYGDVTTIDYVGKLDGVEFDGGKAENQSFFLKVQ